MLPIALDGRRLPLALIGRGERFARRLALLREANPADLAVYSDDSGASEIAGVIRRLPGAVDLAGRRVVYVVGLDEVESRRIAERARDAGALVNVEDIPALCDFHSPSVLRRGDLTIAVSSAGRNPSLSKLVARWLARTFGPEWNARSDELTRRRTALRSEGLSGAALFAALDDHVMAARWLDRN